MNRCLLVVTFVVVLVMMMWLPARTPAEVFERTLVQDALSIRDGDHGAFPELTATMAHHLFEGLDALIQVPIDYRVRPYGADSKVDAFNEIDRAAKRSTQTAWIRSLKSYTLMVLQRLAILITTTLALLPWILVLLIDGWTSRRIREADYHAPQPSLWTASLTGQIAVIAFTIVMLFTPGFSPLWYPIFPIALGLLMRVTMVTWHRFL